MRVALHVYQDPADDSPDTNEPTPPPENPDCGGGDGCGRP